MARAPTSSTTPMTACTICCQQSQTMLDSCRGWASAAETGESGSWISGSAMRVESVSSLQVSLFQALERCRWRGRELGVGIFARLARVYHGTEDDVRAIGENPFTTEDTGDTEEHQRLWRFDSE